MNHFGTDIRALFGEFGMFNEESPCQTGFFRRSQNDSRRKTLVCEQRGETARLERADVRLRERRSYFARRNYDQEPVYRLTFPR
jgi:hypothetical protein